MNKKGQMPKIKPSLSWILIGVAFLIGIYIAGGFKIIVELREQGKLIADNTEKVNQAVEQLNTNLATIGKIPSQIDIIQRDIISLKEKSNIINSDMAKLQNTEKELENSLINLNYKIEELNKGLTEFKNNLLTLKEMQEIYPPVQNQQLIFKNVSNQEVNQAIQNAINSRSRSFGIYFGFGSLFGISLYFIGQLIVDWRKRNSTN